jgi:hypothetical protein
MRFVLLTCLLIGFSLWWFHVPEQILEKPAALCSPDLGQLVQAVQNTYITLVVSIMCQAPEASKYKKEKKLNTILIGLFSMAFSFFLCL